MLFKNMIVYRAPVGYEHYTGALAEALDGEAQS